MRFLDKALNQIPFAISEKNTFEYKSPSTFLFDSFTKIGVPIQLFCCAIRKQVILTSQVAPKYVGTYKMRGVNKKDDKDKYWTIQDLYSTQVAKIYEFLPRHCHGCHINFHRGIQSRDPRRGVKARPAL